VTEIKLGIGLPHAGPLASPANIARAATGAEEIGLDSVWVLDRLLRPRAPAWGDAPPPYYSVVFDPIETLTYVAARTSRVQLGTSVIQALVHPPLLLARRLATLDHLSGGRVIAGLGRGWMPEEFAVAGVALSRRERAMPEFLAALRAAWGPDPVRFDGEIYDIPESDVGPKPAHPIPLLLGYDSDFGIRLAARHADGLNSNRHDLQTLRRDLDLFRETAAAAGRDPLALPVVFRGAARLDDAAGGDRSLFVGSLDQWIEDVEQLAALGIEHIFLQLHTPLEQQLQTMTELRGRVP